MRLTFLIDNLLLAGTQRILLYLVEGLAAQGYRIQVFCLNRRAHPEVVAGLEGAGARVIVLGRSRLLSGVGLWKIFTALRRTDVLQTFLPVSDVLGRTLGRLAGTPRVITSIRARNIDKTPFQLWLDRRTMGWAEKVIFNAAEVVPFSMEKEGVRAEQVVVIPNGVRFPANVRRDRSVVAGLAPADAPLVGTVGRLRPQKGHTVLLEAFARVGGAAHLLIIGDGELRAGLAVQAEGLGIGKQVHFLGVRSDLPALYAALDVYAHPALFEGMPNAVMEAMAAGLPVVATEADGTRALIRDRVTGWLVPTGDADALAARLQEVLADPERARQVGAAAAAYIRENFSVDRMVNAFDGVYRGRPNPTPPAARPSAAPPPAA